MRDIRRPDSLEHVVERLTTQKFSETGLPVFPTIMDLLIFAAGLGATLGSRVEVPANSKGIPVRIFENNEKDGYIFLIALAHARDSKTLAPENDDGIATVFEEFAAAGLAEIERWLNENPTDIAAVSTLLLKLQSQLASEAPVVIDPDPL